MEALAQWAEARDLPDPAEMVRLFPHLCDDLAATLVALEEARREIRGVVA